MTKPVLFPEDLARIEHTIFSTRLGSAEAAELIEIAGQMSIYKSIYNIEDYIPTIYCIQGNRRAYALMLVQLEKCPICEKWMYKGFPDWYKANKDAQMKRANYVHEGEVETGVDTRICIECEKADRATFECVICKEQRKTSEIQVSIGSPAEYLCTNCYSTISAKEWDGIAEKLHEKHRWDYD